METNGIIVRIVFGGRWRYWILIPIRLTDGDPIPTLLRRLQHSFRRLQPTLDPCEEIKVCAEGIGPACELLS